MGSIRRASVAGMFYEAIQDRLIQQIEWAFTHALGPGSIPQPVKAPIKDILGLITPHAGYMYSGPIAAHGYYALAVKGTPDLFIILGPNHTGYGVPVSVMGEGVWETPLGQVVIDSEAAKYIVRVSGVADFDYSAHLYEHSIEVQLPFLQYIYGKFKFVPICLMLHNLDVAKDLAKAINSYATETGKRVVVIATSDFTHYEPHEIAVKKDKMAIDCILELNSKKFYEVLLEHDMSICGPGPIMTLIEYAKMSDAKNVKLLKYATSGDITGDKSAVVGYASIVFSR